MKNRLFIAVILLLAVLFTGAAMANAQVVNGDDDAPSSSVSESTNAPSGTVTNGDDDSSSAPAANNESAGPSGSVVTNGDDDSSVTTSGNVETSAPALSQNGGRRASRLVKASSTLSTLASTSCPVITSYMKMGWKNDSAQVSALQSFLKNVEKMDVAVTGTFDEQTEAAVKAFQKKHLDLVLGPWNATKPSGVVFITTLKVINKIGCGASLSLSADELKAIASYVPSSDVETEFDLASSTDLIGSATGTLDVTLASVENTAAAGDTSLAKKFWNFITGLFR